MHRLFATVVRPLLESVNARTVVEVGAGSGRLTRRLLEETPAFVHAVDPAPSFDPDALAPGPDRLALHEDRSLCVLRGLPAIDLAILDGDPNWYTVVNELRLLAAEKRGHRDPLPVIVVHNVGWPFGRRDGYYDPDAIPEAWRSPHAALGLVPGHAAPSADGLALVPHVGLEDRLPNSGVRTALDDFLGADPERWRFTELPGLYGVGVLASQDRLAADPALMEVLDGFERVEFLASHVGRVERERIVALLGPRPTEVAINGGSIARARHAGGTADEIGGEAMPGADADTALSAEEVGVAAERLDALQSRLELLERDRGGRLRQAEADLRDRDARLRQTEADLRDRDARLRQTEAELHDRDARLRQTEAELHDRDARVRQTEAELHDRDARLRQTEGELHDRDARLRQTEGELHDRDARLRETEGEVRDRDARLRETEAELHDRDARLRETEGELHDREARLRELEIESKAALRDSVVVRLRFEAAQRDAERSFSDLREVRERCEALERSLAEATTSIAEATTRIGDLDAELDRHREAARTAALEAERLQAARSDTEQLRAQLETQVAALLDERKTIGEYVDRAARSHAWRIGHRLTSLARFITFRRNRGTSAISRLQERLKWSPVELPSPEPSLPEDATPDDSGVS